MPRRPLVIHAADRSGFGHATSYDLFDFFYVDAQRERSVLTGEFANPSDKELLQPILVGIGSILEAKMIQNGAQSRKKSSQKG